MHGKNTKKVAERPSVSRLIMVLIACVMLTQLLTGLEAVFNDVQATPGSLPLDALRQDLVQPFSRSPHKFKTRITRQLDLLQARKDPGDGCIDYVVAGGVPLKLYGLHATDITSATILSIMRNRAILSETNETALYILYQELIGLFAQCRRDMGTNFGVTNDDLKKQMSDEYGILWTRLQRTLASASKLKVETVAREEVDEMLAYFKHQKRSPEVDNYVPGSGEAIPLPSWDYEAQVSCHIGKTHMRNN